MQSGTLKPGNPIRSEKDSVLITCPRLVPSMRRIPVQTTQQKGRGRCQEPKELQGHVESLRRQIEELKISNAQLRKTSGILVDVCRSLGLVAATISNVEGNLEVRDALASLEGDIAELLGGPHSAIGHAVISSRPQLQQVPGGTESFLLSNINKSHIGSWSSLSLLQDQHLSLLECSLLAFGSDPLLRQNLAQHMQNNKEMKVKYYESHIEKGRVVLRAFDEAQDAQARAQAAADIACWLLFGLCIAVGLYIIEPSVQFFQGLLSQEPGNPLSQTLGTARIEQITDKLSLSGEQLQQMLVGVQLFSDLQKPLDKQEADLLTSIHQLLQLPGGQPQQAVKGGFSLVDALCRAPAPSSSTSTATAISSGTEASGGTTTALEAGSGVTAAAAATAAATAAGRASKSAASANPPVLTATADPSAQFMLSASLIQDHQELKPLLDQLQKVQCKLLWLDVCAGFFVAGFLTWEQHARYLVESWPNPGSIIPFAKNLAMRSSLRWIKFLEGQYSKEVLP